MSGTRSPSADEGARRFRIPRRVRRFLPRTFQARLTLAFVSVVAITLALVSGLVVNRLDDYFVQQQRADLSTRARTVAEYVATLAESIVDVRPLRTPVVGADGFTDIAVVAGVGSPGQQRILADRLAQADVRIRFGRGTIGDFRPSPNGDVRASLEEPPQAGQTRESITIVERFAVPSLVDSYVVEVTLSDPYTFRARAIANVTGLLIVIGIIAFGGAIVVAAAIAQRFTTPLRRLTEASRALAEGDLGQRIPAGQLRAGSTELAELALQFNAMASRLEESVEIIRRDRDRSRDFLADVSHELRTPLAALRMFNELLRSERDVDATTRAEFLEASAQQIDRLDWLAQNLLDLSKLDSGLVLLDLRPDDLRSTVEAAVEQAEAAAERRHVQLSVELPPDPLRIRHDPLRIGQVVANLVGNGIKFTPAGGAVTVRVRGTRDGARIDVADTGVGIDATELPRIFERFYRGSRATEARAGGSGLGLAIVRSVVDMHHGSVTVESRLGAGSTFTVLLPRDPRHGDEAPGRPPESTGAEDDRVASEPVAEPVPADGPSPADGHAPAATTADGAPATRNVRDSSSPARPPRNDEQATLSTTGARSSERDDPER